MDWKKLGRNLLLLPPWLIFLLSALSAAALVTVFVNGWEESTVAYIVYVLSFYSLAVLTAWIIKGFPRWKKRMKRKVTKNPYANRYMSDVYFKTHVSLYLSLGVNLLYAGLNLLSLFLYRSLWFAVLAGYYNTLAVMRFLLVRYVHKRGLGTDRMGELRRSRLCGIILLTLNVALSGAVLMILYQNRGYEYHGILIYVMAAYTFYVTTHAMINLFRARKYESPVITTARGINLSAALVSMLALETTMLSQFGGDILPQTRRILIAATGAAVELTVIFLSGFIILKSTKELQKTNRFYKEN